MGLKIHEYPLEALDVQDEDFYDVDYWNGTGWDSHKISGATLKAQLGQNIEAHKNFGASTFYNGIGSPISILSSQNLNLNTLIDNGSIVTEETTDYYELNFRYSRTIILGGTSGSANVVIDGVTYPINFVTNLNVTASTFVTSISATMSTLGIQVYAVGSGTTDGRIRFCCDTNTILNGISITNISGSLNGSLKNEFTGLPLADLDHFKVPYVSTPVDGQLLNHTIRVNILMITGSLHHASIGLFDISTDAPIDFSDQVNRNPHTGFNLVLLDVFTSSNNDAKAKNGFYIRFTNPTNTTLQIYRYIKISVVTRFQNPTLFP